MMLSPSAIQPLEPCPNSPALMPALLPTQARPGRFIADMVAARAAFAPHAIAIVSGQRIWTYGDLDRHANQLANRLVSLGVTAETIVPICLDRSPESVMCALAVLKAGGTYLPLDPAQPFERLEAILDDTKWQVLITTAELEARLANQTRTVITDLSCEAESIDAPAARPATNQLAYVIYTSGSSGQPKGVGVTHGNLLNLIDWHQREFRITARDRASHFSSVGFDAAVWEVWPYLTAGASLYLPSDDVRLSPKLLRDWLVKNQITIGFLPTPLAEHVMRLNWPDETELRFLLTGADVLHRYPARGLPFTLVNNYGPTECTVLATSGRILPRDNSEGFPPIGTVIANTSVYILDENLLQVRPGETGELYVGGAAVARGYLNRPDLTAETFIADPFSDEPGARMYRTGDLARVQTNGELFYIGRVDQQIKVRGHRIEPAEIETAINCHPAIAASVVVARGAGREQRLTAYVTMRNGAIPAASQLRASVRSKLPDCMMPALFVKLEALPITTNGKVDRLALPEPTAENTLRDEDFAAPSTPLEHRLAEILCEVFHLTEVSVNDNFFLLGGHSLLGAQLIAKIRTAFGINLPLRTLFDAPTISDLSREIEHLIVARIERMSESEAQALLA